MGFSIGLVGLPNAGKSTIFNALSKGSAQTAPYAFTTIDPNIAAVEIPDDRLEKIASVVKPKKVTRASLEIIDIAGLIKGASQGEGLGNKFLEHIRKVDAVAHVLRCFKMEGVVHQYDSQSAGKTTDIDPKRDLELVETELILADMEIVQKRLDKVRNAAKSGVKDALVEFSFMGRLIESMKRGEAGKIEASNEESKTLKEMNLLTSKPAMHIGNVRESGDEGLIKMAREASRLRGLELVLIDALLEEELADAEPNERDEMLKEYGYKGSGLSRVLKECYNILNLHTFYTVKGDETKSWLLERGKTALEAAEKIHTDIAKGFIKAEVIHYKDFNELGSFDNVKQSGRMEIQGKEYVVQDGDIILFKFK